MGDEIMIKEWDKFAKSISGTVQASNANYFDRDNYYKIKTDNSEIELTWGNQPQRGQGDFTSKVMSKVLASKTSAVTVYKPLIPKSVFITIFGCIITLVIYLLISGEKQENNWFSHIKFSLLYNNGLTSIFKVSKVMLYAVVSTTVMLLVQISFLKNHFNKQLEK